MRLFKRPSTSPQLVSATPIPQDGVASDARTCGDNTEAADEASTRISDSRRSPKSRNDGGDESENAMAAPLSSFSARKGTRNVDNDFSEKPFARWRRIESSLEPTIERKLHERESERYRLAPTIGETICHVR